jgi:hypothetical protein
MFIRSFSVNATVIGSKHAKGKEEAQEDVAEEAEETELVEGDPKEE